MSNNETEMIKSAAETTGKTIDAIREIGGFISQLIKGPLVQGVGIFEDKLHYMRWERQIRLMLKAKEFLKDLGLEDSTRPIPLKIAIPLLQGALLEEDDEIQDRWAKLLVNAGDAESGINVTPIYISILERLSPYDAVLLDKIYSVPKEKANMALWTKNLPDEIVFDVSNLKGMIPHEELELALANLNQLGVIMARAAYGGTLSLACINQTVLGRNFINACRLRNENRVKVINQDAQIISE